MQRNKYNMFEFWKKGIGHETVITKVAPSPVEGSRHFCKLCWHTDNYYEGRGFISATDELHAWIILQKWVAAGAPSDVGWSPSEMEEE